MRSVQTIFLELSGVVCPDVLLEASSYQGDVMISAQSAIGRPTSEAWRNSLHKLAKFAARRILAHDDFIVMKSCALVALCMATPDVLLEASSDQSDVMISAQSANSLQCLALLLFDTV